LLPIWTRTPLSGRKEISLFCHPVASTSVKSGVVRIHFGKKGRFSCPGSHLLRKLTQAELTLLHCPEAEGALKATAYRFCASRQSLEATGTFAFVPV
jgi:hypothetical protein